MSVMMKPEESLTMLARRMDRRTLLGRVLFGAFVSVASVLLQVPRATVAEACTGCAACGSWCNCGDCNSNGQCTGKNCSSYGNCGYPSGGCWTIDNGGGKMCCDCHNCSNSPNPCTCRPRGYGC